MRRIIAVSLFALVVLMGCQLPSSNESQALVYPKAKKVDSVDTYFGTKVSAPYRWMENEADPDLRKWIEAENTLTQNYLAQIPYRDSLKQRLEQLWNYPKMSTPFMKDSLTFYFKNTGMQNQSVLYVKTAEGKERILIDPNSFSDDGTIALSDMGLSKDAHYLAYATSTGGSDWRDIYVKDIQGDSLLKDHIRWAKFTALAWFGNGFFYSGYQPPEKGKELSVKNEYHKLYYHQLGTPQSADKIVMEDQTDPLRMFYATVSDDERFLVVVCEKNNTMGNQIWIKDLQNDAPLKVLVDGYNYEYGFVGNIDDTLFFKTNEGAENYKLVKTVYPATKSDFLEVIPQTDNVLKSITLANYHLIVSYMVDAHSKLFVYDTKGKQINEIGLPTLGTVSYFSGDNEHRYGYYSFNSFLYQSVIYRYDFTTKQSEKKFRPAIDFNFDDYVTEQIFYNSKDGTKIPMFLVHHKDLKKDGTNPTFLYAYGGFNISLMPRFSVSRLVLLENGFVFAMPNLRGGGEYGRKWHEAGMKQHKQNVFDDFIAAEKYLIDNKYTSSEKLVVNGGSNGGLLIGAVTNQRPDLCKVAIPEVGVMDMLRFQKFTIGWNWVNDYGSSDDSVMFKYLYAYSPLHNIKEGVDYPAVLVMTADHDDRVVPAHSFKYTATLQEKYNGANPVLIRIETMAGHGAGKPVSKILDEQADKYAFAFWNIGMKHLPKK